jgi:hypothetical protein
MYYDYEDAILDRQERYDNGDCDSEEFEDDLEEEDRDAADIYDMLAAEAEDERELDERGGC